MSGYIYVNIHTGSQTNSSSSSASAVLSVCYPRTEHKGRDYKLILNYENSAAGVYCSLSLPLSRSAYSAGGIIRSWSREWRVWKCNYSYSPRRLAHKLAKLINEIRSRAHDLIGRGYTYTYNVLHRSRTRALFLWKFDPMHSFSISRIENKWIFRKSISLFQSAKHFILLEHSVKETSWGLKPLGISYIYTRPG